MIETAAARPFEELANDYIFKPLKLESASYGLGSERQQSVLAWGHERGAFGRYRAVKPDPNEFGPQPFGSPAGFLYCSVPDMLRYVDLHLRGANGVATVLRPESFERLHAPLAGQSYALGWDVEVTRDSAGEVIERSIFHGGFTGRDRANMWFCPESGWGAVMVCNSGDGDGTEMGQAFHALLKEIGVTE